jgi:hypothetical protein
MALQRFRQVTAVFLACLLAPTWWANRRVAITEGISTSRLLLPLRGSRAVPPQPDTRGFHGLAALQLDGCIFHLWPEARGWCLCVEERALPWLKFLAIDTAASVRMIPPL